MNSFLWRLLSAWYSWGLFVFFLIGLGMLTLVIYDTRSQRRGTPGWPLLVGLPLVLFLPGLFLALRQPDAPFLLQGGRAGAALVGALTTWFLVALPGVVIPLVSGVTYLARMQHAQLEGAVVLKPQLYDRRRQETSRADPERRTSPPEIPVNAWLVDSISNHTYQLRDGNNRIGRSPQHSEILLSDASVSREHALIRHSSGQFTLYDRGSQTGTLVNDNRVGGPVLLIHGDVIQIGNSCLQFVTDRGEG